MVDESFRIFREIIGDYIQRRQEKKHHPKKENILFILPSVMMISALTNKINNHCLYTGYSNIIVAIKVSRKNRNHEKYNFSTEKKISFQIKYNGNFVTKKISPEIFVFVATDIVETGITLYGLKLLVCGGTKIGVDRLLC